MHVDNILISESSEQENVERLQIVLSQLSEVGLRLKKEKCVFLATAVECLRFKVDAEGLHLLPEKIHAIVEVLVLWNVGELKSLLGLLSYYSRFLPNMATMLAPLYQLLRKGEWWYWSQEQESAFEKAKEQLVSSQVLAHFDLDVEIRLPCDASDYGIGAVLSHRYLDGMEKPVAFMSHTLNKAEKKVLADREGRFAVCGGRDTVSLVSIWSPLHLANGPQAPLDPVQASGWR